MSPQPKTAIDAVTVYDSKVRDLILTLGFFAARGTDDWFGRCFEAKHFTQMQKFSLCMRAHHKFKTSAVGS